MPERQQSFFCLGRRDTVILFVFCGAMAAASAMALFVSHLNIGFPLYRWLFQPHIFFSDWTDLYRLAQYLPDPKLPQLFSPPIDLLGRFAASHVTSVQSAVLFYLLPVLAGLLALFWLTENIFASILVASSYPFFFAIVRGNMEIHVFLLAFIALISLARQKWFLFFALIFLASLIKPFALAFLAVAAVDKPKQAGCVILASITTNLVALYFLGHSNFDAFAAYMGTARRYRAMMAIMGVGDLFNNSLYTLGKLMAQASRLRVLYASAIASLAIITVSYFTACRRIDGLAHFEKSAIRTALVFGTIFYLPLFIGMCISVSADYRLIYFTLSIFFLFTTGKNLFFPRIRCALLWNYFLIITPKHYMEFGPLAGRLRFEPLTPTSDMTVQSILNPVLMMVLCLVLGFGLKDGVKSSSYSYLSFDTD